MEQKKEEERSVEAVVISSYTVTGGFLS